MKAKLTMMVVAACLFAIAVPCLAFAADHQNAATHDDEPAQVYTLGTLSGEDDAGALQAMDSGYLVTFEKTGDYPCPVDLYYTRDAVIVDESNVGSAVSRNPTTGSPDSSGKGEVFFLVRYQNAGGSSTSWHDQNYCPATVSIRSGSCDGLTSLGNGLYEVKGIKSEVVVEVNCKKHVFSYEFAPRPDYTKRVYADLVGTCTYCGRTTTSQVEAIKESSSTYEVTQLGSFNEYTFRTSRDGRSYSAKYAYHIPTSWKRYGGKNRYETMNLFVTSYFNKSTISEAVVIASGRDFPDALSASALAGCLHAPVLLTDPNELPNAVISTLYNWTSVSTYEPAPKLKLAVIIGGPGSVSESVRKQLENKYGLKTLRVSGSNRFETSLAVYRECMRRTMSPGAVFDTVVIASGQSFADALSISPYCFKSRSPIILADSKKGLSADAIEAIRSNSEIKNAIIVGGTPSVPKSVESDLSFLSVKRIAGANRFETSMKITDWEVSKQGMTSRFLTVATGLGFADALAAGPVCGAKNTVLALVSDGYPQGVDSLLDKFIDSMGTGSIIGSSQSVSDAIMEKCTDRAAQVSKKLKP